jgi:hypothetical protein
MVGDGVAVGVGLLVGVNVAVAVARIVGPAATVVGRLLVRVAAGAVAVPPLDLLQATTSIVRRRASSPAGQWRRARVIGYFHYSAVARTTENSTTRFIRRQALL